MPGWEQLGMQLASQTAGAGMGLLLAGINDRRQLKQQGKLQEMQIAGNKQLTDYNMQKQMEMWRNTSYPAQMAMMKAAGLNPALMYQSGGPGGSTSLTQGNVSGANAPTGGGEIPAMAGMGLMTALQAAQIENIKAQTQKTKAETPNVPLAGEKLKAETGNIKIDTALKEIEQQFQTATFKNRESIINIALSKLIEETRIMENNREISDETKQSEVKRIIEQFNNLVKDSLLKEKQTAKAGKEMDHIDKIIMELDQQININKIEEQMAKEGWNPKNAMNPLKWLWNIYNKIF